MERTRPDALLHRIESLPVSVSVRVCERSLTLGELVNWRPGTVIVFDRSPAIPLSICLGDRIIGDGHAVQLGSGIGIQVARIEKNGTVPHAR